MGRYSYSRVGCYEHCPYQFKLRYRDSLKTLPEQNADNALYLGLGVHKGIECMDAQKGVEEYFSHYYCISDENVNWQIQLEYQIPKAIEKIHSDCDKRCKWQHEIEIKTDRFVGFIDLVVGDTIYDFKFSNNIDRYLGSPQLSIYKYYYELLHKKKINHIKFVFIPKLLIRQKKTETIFDFRMRLRDELEKTEVKIIEVPFSAIDVKDFTCAFDMIDNVTEFPKNESRLCDWCEYKTFCKDGTDIDIIAEGDIMKKKLWIYGLPFSGKTTFACKFPNHLVLSTDGNAEYTTDSYIVLKDDVKADGRLTKRTLAWEVFKNQIEKLERKDNKYDSIILDLTEDTYEMCRLYMYDKLKITHESDDSYRAWDKVRTEYLSTMRRFINLDYDNIILLSHEDDSKDITKKNGENITAIRANITEKCALKLAGMVAAVGRMVCDDGKYKIEFKNNEVQFGGGRLGFNNVTVDADYKAVCELFDKKRG